MRLTPKANLSRTRAAADLRREQPLRAATDSDRRTIDRRTEPLKAAEPHAPIDWDHYAASRMHDFAGR